MRECQNVAIQMIILKLNWSHKVKKRANVYGEKNQIISQKLLL
jgi:hypothetical protein